MALPGSTPLSSTLSVEHWVYGVTPGKGYDTKSTSRGLNLAFYDEPLQGHYTPIRGESLQTGGVDALMVHPAPTGLELLLSVVGPGPPDELGRPTFANHTAVLPLDPVRAGTLRLEDAEAAVRDFDRRLPSAVGMIDPLTIPLREAVAPVTLAKGLKQCLTPAALESLATRLLVEPSGRTLILCRESTSETRNRTLRLLVAALNLAGGLPLVRAMSDAPTSSALDAFQVVISPRGVRADNTWTLLDSALDRVVLPRAGGQDRLYATLSACLAQG